MLLYLKTLALFLVIDMVWLGVVAREFYSRQIGFLLTDNVNWAAAIIFYLLFVYGLVVFAISPALLAKSAVKALKLGGLFGLICYATYDLTNLATLSGWPVLVTVVDMVWGTVLGGLVAYLSYFLNGYQRGGVVQGLGKSKQTGDPRKQERATV